MLLGFMRGEIGFEPFGKFAPGKHNTSSAAFTFQSDIRAEACDGPFIGAAGMLLAQAEMVVEMQVWKHVFLPRPRKSF
jgi:hypothetical protein